MSTTAKTASETAALSTIAQAQTLGLVGANTLSVPLPFESKIVLFERVRIAGTTHAPEIDIIMEEIAEDATLCLVREPKIRLTNGQFALSMELRKSAIFRPTKMNLLRA